MNGSQGSRDPKQEAMLRAYVESKMARMATASIDRRTFLKQSAAAAAAGVAALTPLYTGFNSKAVAAAANVVGAAPVDELVAELRGHEHVPGVRAAE